MCSLFDGAKDEAVDAVKDVKEAVTHPVTTIAAVATLGRDCHTLYMAFAGPQSCLTGVGGTLAEAVRPIHEDLGNGDVLHAYGRALTLAISIVFGPKVPAKVPSKVPVTVEPKVRPKADTPKVQAPSVESRPRPDPERQPSGRSQPTKDRNHPSSNEAAKGDGLFDEFDVQPGRGLNLSTPSAGDRSYLTYGFADSRGSVAYVGRASGPGTPQQVLASRLAKGHHVFDNNPGLSPFVVDVQGSLAASRGAEEFFIQGYRQRGAQLLNIDPAVGFSTSARGAKSVGYMDAYFDDLLGRR